MQPLFPTVVEKYECRFSPCRTWRYTWTHVWDSDLPLFMVVGLNPSTADESQPDPTVTRCINRARRGLYGGLIMCNAFAIRGTDPKILKETALDPVGPDNDFWLRRMAEAAATILVAWGNHGLLFDRQADVLKVLHDRRLYCFGTTKQGAPKHPLYLPGDVQTVIFRERD